MNTFATLLLAFPFYLAMKGKLSTYIALAKPDSGAASSQTAANTPSASGMNMNATPTASAPNNATAAASSDTSSVIQNVTHIFGDVATIASV